MLSSHTSFTSAKGGANNDTLFLYGGYTSDKTMASVYTFKTQNNLWSIPKIAEADTIKKYELTGVMDYNGNFFYGADISIRIL
jgi:hypothetical protein